MTSFVARRHSVRRLAYATHTLCEALETRRLLSGVATDDGADLPRNLTPAELEWIANHPDWNTTGLDAPTAPPTGLINPVAEYDPMEGLVVSWLTYTPILGNISKRVTDAGGRMYIGVTNAAVQSSATSTLTGLSVNMDNVTFFTVPLNSVWARDYGPRYVYENDVRVITDHKYNRPTRTSDDLEPVVFGQFKQNQYYEIGINGITLVHGGGNFHLNTSGDAYATRLIVNENPALTPAQIQQIWSTYEGDNVTITDPFPTSVDATQHIDMWMQIFDDNKAFVSDWPNNVGSTQDVICDTWAATLQSRGYQVTRLNAYSIAGVHYTFTNMVLFNDIAILPQYNNGPGAAESNAMLARVQAAMPGKTVFQLNSDQIIPAAGSFHCIVQHVPVHKGLAGPNGGLAPTAYVRNTPDGQTFNAGQALEIKWISDDDAPDAASGGVSGVDILLSTDGGATFPTTIATNRPALGSFVWTVPGGINTTQARVRVVARDGLGNTGFDVTDANFTITDPVVPAVSSSAFLFETAPHRLSFAFNQNVGASLDTGDIVLENLTTSQTIPSSDLTVSFNTGTNTATFTYTPGNGVLADGNYRATLLAAGITTPGGTPMSANYVFNTHVLAGDANRDKRVNLDDFNILAGNFGLTGRTFSQGNFNYDAGGNVNLDDFNILASRFGVTLTGPSIAGGSIFGQTRVGDSKKNDTLGDLLA